MADLRNMSLDEKRVLELIREKDYQIITIRIKDGKIVNIKREESIDLDLSRSEVGNRKNLSL